MLELILNELEKDNEIMEFDNATLDDVIDEIEIQKFDAHILAYTSEKDRLINDWVELEISKFLSSYSGKGYISVDNLYVAEGLVKTHNWKCLRVLKDNHSNKKSWILIQGEKTDNPAQ